MRDACLRQSLRAPTFGPPREKQNICNQSQAFPHSFPRSLAASLQMLEYPSPLLITHEELHFTSQLRAVVTTSYIAAPEIWVSQMKMRITCRLGSMV